MVISYNICNFSYTYPLTSKPALSNITIQLELGKIYGVIGANASGKSSLCLSLKGYIPHFYKGKYSGKILLNNTIDLLKSNECDSVGFVFSDPFSQLSHIKKTVFEEIAFSLENRSIPVQQIESLVTQVMQLLNIEQLALQNPLNLSGGQVQRVAIACVIVNNPEILILDEPTSQLDPEETKNIYNFLQKYRDEGHTVIISEQDTNLLAEYADNIIVLQNGFITHYGNKYDVFYDETFPSDCIDIPEVVKIVKKLRNFDIKITPDITDIGELIVLLKEKCDEHRN